MSHERLPGRPSEAGPPTTFDLSGGVWPGDDALLSTPAVLLSSGAVPVPQASGESSPEPTAAAVSSRDPEGSSPVAASTGTVLWSCWCFSGRWRRRVVLTVQSVAGWAHHGVVVASVEKSVGNGELRVAMEGAQPVAPGGANLRPSWREHTALVAGTYDHDGGNIWP